MELVRRLGEIYAVEIEEDDRREDGRPLVPVDEGLVLRDVEGVDRRHREEIFMEQLTPEAGHGHRDGRGEQAGVAHARGTAEGSERLVVDGEDVVDIEELRIGHFASLSRSFLWVPRARLVAAATRRR